LEAELSAMPKPDEAVPQKRSLEDMVAEILALSREGARFRKVDIFGEQIEGNLRAFYGDALGEARKVSLAEMALAGEVPEGITAGEKMSPGELLKKHIKK
jgi:hypothetical protein